MLCLTPDLQTFFPMKVINSIFCHLSLHFSFTYHTELYFSQVYIFGRFSVLCSLGKKAENYSWILWIKKPCIENYAQTCIKHYYNNEMYLQYIHSHMNIARSHVWSHLLLITEYEVNIAQKFSHFTEWDTVSDSYGAQVT